MIKGKKQSHMHFDDLIKLSDSKTAYLKTILIRVNDIKDHIETAFFRSV